MNLSQLINSVHKDERIKNLRLRKDEVRVVVKVTIDHMFKGLLEYGKLKLQGLFTLDIREWKGRRIRNPQTKEYMFTKDTKKVGLEPSKRLKESLKKL